MTADEIRQLKPLTYRNVLSHFQGGGSVSLQATRAVGRPMFEYVALSWVWSYGDSNPRPLACHSKSAPVKLEVEDLDLPLTCEDRPLKVAEVPVGVCTVGPFGTTSGTRWDQDRGQDQALFESSNTWSGSRRLGLKIAAQPTVGTALAPIPG